MNCVECFTLRLLLEHILSRLRVLGSPEDGSCAEVTCDTFNDFVRLFKQITKAESLKDQTVYIVSNLMLSPFRKTFFTGSVSTILTSRMYAPCKVLLGVQGCVRWIPDANGALFNTRL